MTELRRPIAGSGDGTCQRKCRQGLTVAREMEDSRREGEVPGRQGHS